MTTTNKVFTDHSATFHLKEYEYLRREIELVLKDYHALERNVVIAVGVTWAFLWEKHTPAWTYYIPLLFAVLGAVRSHGINKTFRTFHGYLSKLEESFSTTGGPGGWEHFFKGKTGFSSGSLTFWAILIIATLVVAVLRSIHVL